MNTGTQKIKESLVSLGLSTKEAAIYIALLELGRSTVSQVSRRAAVNRATGYVILDSLVAKGLISISGKKPKQEYIAESPDILPELFKKQQAEAAKREEQALQLTASLKALQKVGDRPQVRFYEGVEGIRAVFEDSLTNSSGKIVAFTSIEDQHVSIPNYFPEYYQRRKKNKIFMRSIFPDTKMGIERQAANTKEYRESILVPSETYGIHPALNVYDDKVMIASFREKLGIIIESAEIADAMKKIFELAWIGAHSLKKNTE